MSRNLLLNFHFDTQKSAINCYFEILNVLENIFSNIFVLQVRKRGSKLENTPLLFLLFHYFATKKLENFSSLLLSCRCGQLVSKILTTPLNVSIKKYTST